MLAAFWTETSTHKKNSTFQKVKENYTFCLPGIRFSGYRATRTRETQVQHNGEEIHTVVWIRGDLQ